MQLMRKGCRIVKVRAIGALRPEQGVLSGVLERGTDIVGRIVDQDAIDPGGDRDLCLYICIHFDVNGDENSTALMHS
jgi:hypothetical protein